jgi:hypothetical protein
MPQHYGDILEDVEFPDAPVPAPAPAPPSGGVCPPGYTGTPPNCRPPLHPTPTPAPGAPTPGPDDTAVPRGPVSCPPGQVPKSNGQGCKPASQWYDESENELSKAGKETCDPMAHPGIKDGRYDCYWCNFTTRKWERGYCPPGGAGGAASGSGVARAASQAITPGAGSTAFGADLEKYIRDALASPSRYTPQALQALYGEIARQSSGQIARGERAVRADAARRGMSRAGQTSAALRAVREGAEAQRGQATVGVQTAKLTADFQDKMSALDRAQRYLDSLRDNEYRYMLASEQRRQFDANLALGYANLNQQRTLLQMSLQSQWDMLRANQGFLLLNQGA